MVQGKIKKALDGRDSHIKTLRLIIGFLSVVCVGLIIGWQTAPSRIMIDIPPDLRAGSTRAIGERHPFNIYAFGLYIWQQMNNWPVEGSKDYAKRIQSLSCFITPEFKAYLESDYENRRKRYELTRTRAVQEMPDRGYEPKRVFIESNESWVAFFDINVKEYLKGSPVKNVFIRFPLRIVTWDVDPECNLWGLALDGFYSPPARLETSMQDDFIVNDPRLQNNGPTEGGSGTDTSAAEGEPQQ